MGNGLFMAISGYSLFFAAKTASNILALWQKIGGAS
jgi:hypothetical protein